MGARASGSGSPILSKIPGISVGQILTFHWLKR